MEKLTQERVIEKLQERFGGGILEIHKHYDIFTVTFDQNVIHDAVKFLHDDEELQFGFMTTMCGLHYPTQEKELGLMYQFHQLNQNVRIRFKTFFTKNNAEVPTVTDIYKTANWMEREAYDFYGIRFTGHPNLKRILNVEEMDYFPMRKEYKLEDETREDKNDAMFGRD